MQSVKVTEVPQGAQLIDVREPEEYADIHATGAVSMPMSSIVGNTGDIDPDRDIYVICKAGGRSLRVAEYLEQALGWDNVINVEGGTDAWVAAGLPTEK